ncbi:MAG: hypothetical protein JSS44_06110 [Proteobacteria bacterium]|nr:hypothetical protein [Pseudomonadota bacterium]MBS0464776.1 hypothetical protein [Pseudomonadota bacterium]
MQRAARITWKAAGAALAVTGMFCRSSVPSLTPGVAYALMGVGVAMIGMGIAGDARSKACDTASVGVRQRYLREFLPAMGGYVVALFVSIWLLKGVEQPALRAVLALLPVPPVILAVRAIVRYIRGVDELQQRIELEAIGTATALVSMAYFSAGFLQSAKVIAIPADMAMMLVFPVTCVVYGVAKALLARRYS